MHRGHDKLVTGVGDVVMKSIKTRLTLLYFITGVSVCLFVRLFWFRRTTEKINIGTERKERSRRRKEDGGKKEGTEEKVRYRHTFENSHDSL